jgi:hypothetical protein
MNDIPKQPELQPRWLTEHYEGMEQDIMDWYYAFYFHKVWDGNNDSIRNTQAFAETVATARLQALIQTGAIRSRSGKSFMLQLYEAKKSAWWKDLDEVHDIGQLIEIALWDAMENDPTGGNRYELEKLLKIIFACEQMGVDKSLIISVPENISKARESTRVIDHIMQSDAKEREKVEQIEGILKEVGDKTITFEEFRKHSHARMGKVGKTVMPPVPASLYLLPGGKEFILIETDNKTQTRAIESALKGLIDGLFPRDINDLMRRISEKAFTKGKQHLYQCRMGGIEPEPYIKQADEGVILPTPDEFRSLAFRELAHISRFLPSLLQVHEQIEIPIFEVGRVSISKDPDSLAASLFHFDGGTEKALAAISSAIGEFYSPIGFDVMFLVNNCPTETILNFNQGSFALEVSLQIERMV